MKSHGVQTVYVAGHSLGAIAAAGYGARFDDVDGLILLAPGHFIAWPGFHKKFIEDLRKADEMIKSGKGDKKSNFGDINAGKWTTRYITANVFKSWFSDTGPAEFVANMMNIKGGIPVLYVAGSQDRIPQTKNREYAFDKVPANPNSQFNIIASGHLDVPRKSDEIVIEWLRKM
jgi:pimeloyl-ACP methyl ester carboxylesterase